MNEDQYEFDFDNVDLGNESVIDDVDTFTITIPDSLSDSYSSYSIDTSDINLDSFSFNYNPGVDITAGDLTVHNEGDIKLGDRSLKEFMNKVEERMNILQPNPELEEQWEELKKIGDAYRELEKELLEKSKMWEALKKE